VPAYFRRRTEAEEVVFAVLFAFLLLQSLSPHDIEGVWWTRGGNAQVEIVETGTSVQGTIIWTAAAAQVAAGERVKKEDLPEVYRIGKVLFENYERGSEGWENGTIYSLEDGKSYTSSLRRVDQTTLAVEGCLGIFCRTQLFTLADDDEIQRLQLVLSAAVSDEPRTP
jgi:uncharacterized protein (DUF2147 family)